MTTTAKYNLDLMRVMIRNGPRWWCYAKLPAERTACLTPTEIMVLSLVDALHRAGIPASFDTPRRYRWWEIEGSLDEDMIAEYSYNPEPLFKRAGGGGWIHIDLPDDPPRQTEFVSLQFEYDGLVIYRGPHQEQTDDREQVEIDDSSRHDYADPAFFDQVRDRLAALLRRFSVACQWEALT